MWGHGSQLHNWKNDFDLLERLQTLEYFYGKNFALLYSFFTIDLKYQASLMI